MSDQKKDELNISPELFKEIRNEICYSKDELHDWIKTYLKIDLPNTTISENSNGNPMDMVWWCYNNAIHSSGKTSKKAMFVASRGGMKTLGASIIELLMVSHAKRDVVHIGAILKTAKRCYQYFQGFFRQNGFDDLLFKDSNGNIKQPIMEKTILSNGTSLEILPCTLAACNDPESLVIRGSEKVKIKDLRIGDKIRGINVYNNKINEVEIQNIKNVLKPSFLLKFENGSEFICSSDHLILTNYGWIPASKLQTEHDIVCDSWNSNEKSQWEKKFESYKQHEYFYDLDGLPVLEAKKYNNFDDLEKTKIKEKIFVGHRKLISIKINQKQFSKKNFVCNGIVQHNCNGPHTPFVCLDEIDAVQDMQGYDDISGIPVKTKDGKPPIEIGISTMKTASGLVAQEINAAPNTGLEVFYWNLIDLTKKCPDSRSGTKKIPIYANLDTLEAISEEEWKDRTDSERKNFEKREGLEGCLSRCKMYAACLANLKNQTSDSNMLNDVEFTEQKIFSKAPEWVNAQLLCRKPSLEGIIYSRFTNKGNIKSYQQMYEIFMGQEWPHKRNCSFDDLRSEFSKAGMRPNMAVDFGDHLAVLLLIYTDGKDRSFVVKEKTFTATDDAELAHWAITNWGKYDVNMVYADPASPSGIRLLTKAGFVCHHKVNKDVWGGINTVRRFINVPGTNRSALFIHDGCENLIYEFPRYSRKYNKSLDVFMEDPVKKEDHSLDCLRYYLHTKYDGMEAHLGFFDDHIKQKEERTEVPDIEQVALENDIMGFVDNSDDFIRDEETGELRKKTDVEKNNESGGGGFSFF